MLYKDQQVGDINKMEKKLFGHRLKKGSSKDFREHRHMDGKAKDNPPKYEGKEHIKYEDPGYSEHEVRYPEDEPHMKSHVRKDEEHQMEDDYEMDVPHQTDYDLPAKIARARMKMDAPDQEEPDKLQGRLVHQVPLEGVKDTSGDEEEGPNEMQKEGRKKLIVAVMKRKMKKGDGYNESLDAELETDGKKFHAHKISHNKRFGMSHGY